MKYILSARIGSIPLQKCLSGLLLFLILIPVAIAAPPAPMPAPPNAPPASAGSGMEPGAPITPGAKSTGSVTPGASVTEAGDAFVPDKAYLKDRAALDKLQYDAFLYMWEGGHPASGMAYEGSAGWGETRPVALGGTGFGVAAIVVAVDRGWLPREKAIARLMKIVVFLRDKTPREELHGAFPHWLNGDTGETVPFGEKDRGADIVETSLLMQGLLIARAYFNGPGAEAELRRVITELWEAIDWHWFTDEDDNGLHWHWNSEEGFSGLKILGYNECLITYVLAISSPTRPISRKAYDYWTSGQGYRPKDLYGYRIEAALPGGGPLFLAHYSFIGLDPNRMADAFVPSGYFIRNLVHTLSNRGYCLQNAPARNRYSEGCWGLTASQVKGGYAAGEPARDSGTIAPTAALSSLPYTPHYSMQVLASLLPKPDRSDAASSMEGATASTGDPKKTAGKTKQAPSGAKAGAKAGAKEAESTPEAVLKKPVWGPFGPYDAFSLRDKWVSDGWLAIDQLPMVCMAENYRSGLLWNLFMSDADIRRGLQAAGISEPVLAAGFPEAVVTLDKQKNKYIPNAYEIRRHPDSGLYLIPYRCGLPGKARFTFADAEGTILHSLEADAVAGRNILAFPQFMPPAAASDAPPLTLSMRAPDSKIYTLPVRLY